MYEANRHCYAQQAVYDLSLKCNQTFNTQVSLLVDFHGAHLYDKRKYLCRLVRKYKNVHFNDILCINYRPTLQEFHDGTGMTAHVVFNLTHLMFWWVLSKAALWSRSYLIYF